MWSAMESLADQLRGVVRTRYVKLAHAERSSFSCPICGYHGPFSDYRDQYHSCRDAMCPSCQRYERHRLQFLVLAELAKTRDFSELRMLHFAPEPSVRKLYRRRFAEYHTADIEARGVDFRADMRQLPFADRSYDVVLASHVLEHIAEDERAIAEIARVLRPSGFALLPVPIISTHTVEYGAPNPHEFGHVRAPGLDYFERYRKAFGQVSVWSSSDFDERYQLHVYEDRTRYPCAISPHRTPMPGDRHPDYVPVCFA